MNRRDDYDACLQATQKVVLGNLFLRVQMGSLDTTQEANFEPDRATKPIPLSLTSVCCASGCQIRSIQSP
jgi:hypothetical protein